VLVLAFTAIAVLSSAWAAQPPAVDVPPGPIVAQPGNLPGQADPPAATEDFPELPPISGLGDFGLGDAADADKILVFASFTERRADQPARLFVSAKMGSQWHIYSLTQPAGAVKATAVDLDPSDQYQLLGSFVPDQDAEVRRTEVFDVPLEEHYGTVTFSAPIELTAGVDPSQLRITGKLSGMLCHDELGCIQLADVDTAFTAQLATDDEAENLLALVPARDAGRDGYRAQDTHAILRGYVVPGTIQPGTVARLVLTADVDPGWKIYAYEEKPVPGGASSPTHILLQSPEGWRLRPPAVTGETKTGQVTDFPDYYYHVGRVTWTADILVPADAKEGEHLLEGLIAYQTCSNQCDRPVVASFSAAVEVVTATAEREAPLTIAASDMRYREVADLLDAIAPPPSSADPRDVAAARPDADITSAPAAGDAGAAPKFDAATVKPVESVTVDTLWKAIALGFLGGIILNVMPCVLPVIGLKVLAFFQQAGESRSRALWLNVWYACGIVSVFIVLAALGVGLSEMFTVRAFGIIMAVVVFAMALSLMGLWELQVPSFLGGSTAQKLMEKEGAVGAFFKGILTTLLAIPCGAPFLSPALNWAGGQVHAGAPQNVYIVFTVIGVGMASPYLVLGAFPELLRFIPKPGPWMETFKKAMGYLLLTAVLFILYFVDLEDMLPTVALLFSVWLACWLVGMLPITARGSTKALVWTCVILMVAGTYYVGFHWLLHPKAEEKLATAASRQVRDGKQDEAVQLRVSRMSARELAALEAFVAEVADPGQDAAQAAPQVDLVAATVNGESGAAPPDSEASEEGEYKLPWKAFDRRQFDQFVAAKNTILIDFTADWCLTCKTLEATVLNTRAVRELVDRNGVVTIQADWTRRDPEVTEMLEALGAKQVPIWAIFPAGKPNEPLVFRGGVGQKKLLQALQKAGPSANAAAQGRTARKQS
jgi:thiol:disulfide interchange protein